MGLDYIMQEVTKYLKFESRGQLLEHSRDDIKRNVTSLIRCISIIAQIYDRQIDVCRYLWALSFDLENFIHVLKK